MQFIKQDEKLVILFSAEQEDGTIPDEPVLIAQAIKSKDGYYVAKLLADILYTRYMLARLAAAISELNTQGSSNDY